MFKMYIPKARVCAIKYDGKNIEEINSFIETCNEYVKLDMLEGKIKSCFKECIIKLSSTMSLDNGTKVLLIYTEPSTTEMFVKEGSYIIFDIDRHSISSLPENSFIASYEEDKTVNLYD